MEAVPYTASDAELWDAWCLSCDNATFQHSRRFLAYHGERFVDASLMLREEGKLLGVLPAALSPESPACVISHPGATYGGFVHAGSLAGNRMIEALAVVSEHHRSQGRKRLVYKPLPYIYAQAPAQDDLYALFRHNAKRVRCDLASAIDLAHRRQPSERRRRGLKKAQRAASLSSDPGLLDSLWLVVQGNLQRKHGVSAVHSIDELRLLARLFSGEILLRAALVEGRVEAGVIFFNTRTAWHAQYIASSEKGYDISALDWVFESAVVEAAATGARYFDFGTSNEEGGRVLNDGLYRFKSEFGGGGVAFEAYELEL